MTTIDSATTNFSSAIALPTLPTILSSISALINKCSTYVTASLRLIVDNSSTVNQLCQHSSTTLRPTTEAVIALVKFIYWARNLPLIRRLNLKHIFYSAGFILVLYHVFKHLSKINFQRYKHVDITKVSTPTLRPFSIKRLDPRTGAPDHRFAYRPSQQDEASEILDEIDQINNEVVSIRSGQCRACKRSFTSCNCQAHQDDMRPQLRDLALKHEKLSRRLRRMDEIDPHPAFTPGDTISFSLEEYSAVARWVSPLSCSLKVRFLINQKATVGDSRPNGERHIRCGNSTFYGLELLSPELSTPFGDFVMPFWVNRMLGLPMRDTFVSEDLIRYTRRGYFTKESAKAIKASLENCLSVPLNDPVFVANNISALGDSLRICYSCVTGDYPHPDTLN